MSDLISRQDAIRKCCGEKCGCEREDCGYEEACSEVMRLESLPSADRPTGECRTCGRNADNGGVHEDGRTKCPIQEHYALLLDGYCHLYEPYDCGAKMGGDSE